MICSGSINSMSVFSYYQQVTSPGNPFAVGITLKHLTAEVRLSYISHFFFQLACNKHEIHTLKIKRGFELSLIIMLF